MNRPVRFGICMWCIPVTGPSLIRTAHEMGFSGVVADLGRAEEGFPLSRGTLQKEYLHERERYGVEYPTLAVNEFCRTGMSRPEKQEEVMSILDLAVDTAAALGAGLLQLPSFVDGLIQSEEGFDSTARCLKYACRVASGKNLLVGTENALSVDDNFRMLAEVAEPNLRIYFDTANPLFMAGGMYAPDLLRAMRDRICEIHVKDVRLDPVSGEFHFVPLGAGETDFEESARILVETEYQGWIHLENELDMKELMQDVETLRERFAGRI